MSTRDELSVENPLLHQALESSWRIALETWLPTISPHMGSHNGYPHLYHMELLLDRVVQEFGKENRGNRLVLSPTEKYVILAAILFHDIGRISDSEPHAEKSFRMVSRNWPELGIPSSDLAGVIALAAGCHNPGKKQKSLPSKLTEVSVETYGRIRARGLTAILVLLDMMDTSRLRITPKESANRGPKEFRSLVQGIEIDADARLIRSVIGADSGLRCDNNGTLVVRSPADAPLMPLTRLTEKDCSDLQAAAGNARAQTWPITSMTMLDELRKTVKRIQPLLDPLPLTLGAYLKALCKDLVKNTNTLKLIHNDLLSVGIALDKWFLECGEHLFDCNGHEVWEPTLDKAYLDRIAKQMWDLSTRVFGRSVFDYEYLAAGVKEPDIARVRLAARRLRIIASGMDHESCAASDVRCKRETSIDDSGNAGPGAIETNEASWRWLVSCKNGTCACVQISRVSGYLEKLHEQQKQGDV